MRVAGRLKSALCGASLLSTRIRFFDTPALVLEGAVLRSRLVAERVGGDAVGFLG